MQRLGAIGGGAILALTIGLGTVSADPITDRTRFVYGVECGLASGGPTESVDFALTVSGAAAHDLNSSRVFVLMGATVNGAWVVPLAEPGQAKKDLVACSFISRQGNAVVWYGKWKLDTDTD
jgi:hypothetical protein